MSTKLWLSVRLCSLVALVITFIPYGKADATCHGNQSNKINIVRIGGCRTIRGKMNQSESEAPPRNVVELRYLVGVGR